MCGINGFNFKDRELISAMNKITAHRGPDDSGIFITDKISLGHNRLSIIDLSKAASQPMKSYDNSLVTVFNGEIYNFRELKEELKNDYPFSTQSDTEVILAAYEKWRHNCVRRFNGIFAFAVWDSNKQELFMARDQAGVKPLYYYHNPRNGEFIFSSEIKAILEHSLERVLDIEAFNHYMKVLYASEPLTMFKGIKKFPKASYGVFKNNTFKISRYWEAEEKDLPEMSESELAKIVREQVYESVNKQLVSDRPVGVYLSGGIDSSAILHSIYKSREFSGRKINTFSVGFDLQEREEAEKFNADCKYAARTAEYYGTSHHEARVGFKDVMDNFEKAVWHMDEPISHPTAVPMMLLAKLAKKDAAVVFSGDGGDELFGGDERFRLSMISDTYQKMPRIVRSLLNKHPRVRKLDTKPGIERYKLLWFNKSKLPDLIGEEFLREKAVEDFFFRLMPENNNGFEKVLMDMERESWLVDYSLTLSDKMSMAFGLENRVPFLDKDLIEFSLAIPIKYKFNIFSRLNKKRILREAFKGRLPDFLFKKQKSGWVSPGAKWLRRPEFSKFARDILSADYYSGTKDMFKWGNARRMLEGHIHGGPYNLITIWALLTFQVWAKQFKIKVK